MLAGNWEAVIEPSSALGRRAASVLDSITSEPWTSRHSTPRSSWDTGPK